MKKILTIAAVIAVVIALPACKSKVKDADIKQDVQTALLTVPANGELAADVKNGVVTVSGEVKDAAAQASVEPAVKDIRGVKSVVNNTTIMTVADTPVVTPDDPLTIAVKDAVKDNPGVNAQVNDGVVTLTGSIKKSDLPKLMQKINATKPKKIENQLTIN
jgi:hyperosmotically inducible protein